MSRYLILIHQDEKRLDEFTDAERADLLAEHGAFQAKHGAKILHGAALQRSATARTIAVGDGSLDVTDGPYAEVKEALGGFYLVEAADLDEAIALAAEVPAPHGGVEVRPVLVLP